MEAAATVFLATPEFNRPIIAVSPNPAGNFITIDANGVNVESITITDMNGRIVAKGAIAENTIDISRLENGVYFVRVITQSGSVTKKIVKK